MKAGRELDAKIAEEVMGHDMENDFCTICDDSFSCDRPIPHYSTQIADTWPALGKFPGHVVAVAKTPLPDGTEIWDCTIGLAAAEADTAPLAICLAALKAVEGGDVK